MDTHTYSVNVGSSNRVCLQRKDYELKAQQLGIAQSEIDECTDYQLQRLVMLQYLNN
jgi:hypothetical protein